MFAAFALYVVDARVHQSINGKGDASCAAR